MKSKVPFVTVVIPCYNHGEYISDAIDSVRSQTYPKVELIIVNDGSTDKATIDFLKKLESDGYEIIHQENKGLAAARNAGVNNARGKYILPLDSDDYIDNRYIEEAVSEMENDYSLGIIYAKANYFGQASGSWNLPEFDMKRMLINNLIFCSALYRREDFKKVGGYDSKMQYGLEDWDFWLGILSLGRKVKRINEFMFYYRIRDKSMLNSISSVQKQFLRDKIVAKHYKLYLKANLNPINLKIRNDELERKVKNFENSRMVNLYNKVRTTIGLSKIG